jgi:hypothetical protein
MVRMLDPRRMSVTDIPLSILDVAGLQAWFHAADLGLAHGANPSPWNPKINNTGQSLSLLDAGVDAKYNIGGMPVPSVDFTSSSGLAELLSDTRPMCPAVGESLINAFTYRTTDNTNDSIFSTCGVGAFSSSSTGYRGFDWRVDGSGIVSFRTKGTDNSQKSASATSAIANNTNYVFIGVRDSADDVQHVWVNGLWHGSVAQATDLKHATTPGVLNIGSLTNGSTAWSPPALMSDWNTYVRAAAVTNAAVNIIGSYFARRIGATWTDVTELPA